tara:strand:+ start:6682 stop:8229 length:1548 start_codon:yes stop_codon:yes gene_type:complete
MKSEKLLFLVLFFVIFVSGAQNLHTQANAASINNEANTVTGWTTNNRAIATSSSVNPFAGSFSISIASNGNIGGFGSYTFNAVIGQVYDISIWAREGNLSFQPAFANWSGFSNFSTTLISGSTWTQYTWSLTANSTSPEIRIYSAPYSGGQNGTQVLVDNISIVQQGGGADNQAPTAPTGLSASGTTTTTTNLAWAASTDNVAVTGYNVLQNGVNIGATNGATTFNVAGLTQNTTYAFTVTARDAAGNVSGASNTVNVTTLTAVDNQAPTAPTGLSASGTTTTTTNLAWAASTDNVAVTGYNILQNGVNIGTTNGAATFNVAGLTPNTTYAFTVTARDAAGNVSGASNTVNVTTTGGGGGIIDYTSENSNLATVDWTARDLFANRNVGIGTTNTQGYRLAVAGSVVAEEVNVKLQVNWPDFVFEGNYNLPSLKEVEDHIKQKGYLLNMPSAAEVESKGIEIGKMNAKLLQKIEELTLYTIAQEKKIESLEQENKRIDSLAKKISELEESINGKKQ